MLVVGQFAFALSEQAQTLQRASMGDLWMHAGPQHHARALGTMELCCEHYPPPPPPLDLTRCAVAFRPVLEDDHAAPRRGDRQRRPTSARVLSLNHPRRHRRDRLRPGAREPGALPPQAAQAPDGSSTLLPSALHARPQAASAGDHAVPRELLGRRARHRPAGTDREPPSLVRRHSRVQCSAALTANRACGRRTTLGWSVPHRARWDSLTALIRVAFSQTVPKAVAKLGQMNCWSIGVVVCEHISPSPDLPTWHPLPILLTWCLWEQTSRTPSRWR